MTIEEFFNLMSRLADEAIDETARVELGAIAVRFRDDLNKAVREQRYPMPELSKAWLGTKRRQGLDLRKLIASGNYLRGIKARRFDQRSWIVEPSKEKVRPYKFQKKAPNITYQQLAAIHEFGAGFVPARPHWRPTILRYQKNAGRLGKEVQAAFARRLKRKVSRAMRAT